MLLDCPASDQYGAGMKKNNDSRMGPVPDQANAVWNFFGPVPDCSGVSFHDADFWIEDGILSPKYPILY
jgi:hypothetical protein